MSEARRELAEAVLSSGGRIGEALPQATASRIARYAEQYREAGVTDDDLLVFSGLTSDTLLAAVVACWNVGAAAWVTPREPETFAAHGASFTVTPGSAEEITVTRHATTTTTATAATAATTAMPVPAGLGLLHETSGSTGEPRLARRSVESIRAEHIGYREGLGLDAEDTMRIPVPVAHSFGSGVALAALLSGCRVDARPFTTASSVAHDLDRGSSTKLAITPALLRLLTKTRRTGDSRPRAILVGAGTVSDELDAACVARFGVPVTRGYGSSETGGMFIGSRGLGQPIPAVGIVAPDPGSRGELLVRTATPVWGYAHEPVRDSLLWRTGDIVERDASGQVWFVEREQGAVRANGKFVDVSSIRAAVGEVEGVEEIEFLVLPRAGDADLEDVYAVVSGRPPSRETVENALYASVPPGVAPRLRIFAEFPRTDIGKLDRTALTEWIRAK